MRRLVLVIGAALTLIGCGGSSDADDGVASPSSTASSNTSTPVTATPGPNTTPATVDASEVIFSGDADSEWCVASRELDALGDEMAAVFYDPIELERASAAMVTAVGDAAPLAPPELAADVATVAAGMQKFRAAMDEVGFDLLNADLSKLQFDAAYQAASDRLDAYDEQVCGIYHDDWADEASSGQLDPAAGTPVEQLVAILTRAGFTEDEATCVVENIDFDDDAIRSGDPAALAPVFEVCDIDPTRLEQIAEVTG